MRELLLRAPIGHALFLRPRRRFVRAPGLHGLPIVPPGLVRPGANGVTGIGPLTAVPGRPPLTAAVLAGAALVPAGSPTLVRPVSAHPLPLGARFPLTWRPRPPLIGPASVGPVGPLIRPARALGSSGAVEVVSAGSWAARAVVAPPAGLAAIGGTLLAVPSAWLPWAGPTAARPRPAAVVTRSILVTVVLEAAARRPTRAPVVPVATALSGPIVPAVSTRFVAASGPLGAGVVPVLSPPVAALTTVRTVGVPGVPTPPALVSGCVGPIIAAVTVRPPAALTRAAPRPTLALSGTALPGVRAGPSLETPRPAASVTIETAAPARVAAGAEFAPTLTLAGALAIAPLLALLPRLAIALLLAATPLIAVIPVATVAALVASAALVLPVALVTATAVSGPALRALPALA